MYFNYYYYCYLKIRLGLTKNEVNFTLNITILIVMTPQCITQSVLITQETTIKDSCIITEYGSSYCLSITSMCVLQLHNN